MHVEYKEHEIQWLDFQNSHPKKTYEKFEEFRNFVSHDLFESHKSASFVHSCDPRGKVSSESGVYALCETDMRAPQAIGPTKGVYMRLMQDFLDLICMHLNCS